MCMSLAKNGKDRKQYGNVNQFASLNKLLAALDARKDPMSPTPFPNPLDLHLAICTQTEEET
jgi:hypothetical protein